jgi:hypothetical protein
VVHTAFQGYPRAWAVGLVLLVGGGAVSATLAQQPPTGLELGPWVVAPTLSTGYAVDDNVFYENEDNADSDRITTLRGDVRAVLPFHKSQLQLDYTVAKEHYQTIEFDRDVMQEGKVDLRLAFRSGDELRLRDTYRSDFARAEIEGLGDETGFFRGEPFSLNRWEVEFGRTDPRRQGYVIHVEREDFIYDEQVDIGSLEHRGFRNFFEYRQPLPANRSWVMRYDTRRFNYYRPSDPVGVPLRNETTDALLFGLRGFLGEGRPYRIHLGYALFRYEGDVYTKFQGIVGTAAWALRLGGRTRLDIEAIRRPLPSNFETYYINNAGRAALAREWQRFDTGAEIELTKNVYADEIIGYACDGPRRDFLAGGEIFGTWHAHERMRFRVSAFHKVRSSNCELADYVANGIETAVSTGWF